MSALPVRVDHGQANSIVVREVVDSYCHLVEPAPRAITLQGVFDWYCANPPRPFAPVSWRERKRIMQKFCLYRGPEGAGVPYGNRAITEFKPFHLLQFVKAQPGLKSPWSVKRWATTLKAPLTEALLLGLIDRNPFVGIRLPGGGRGRDWTPAEFQALLRNAPAHFRRLLIFIRFSGARPGEARLSQWSMVRPDAGCIVVREHKTAHLAGAPRRIRLNHVTLKLLVWIKRHQPEGQAHIFPNREGRPWSLRMLVALFDKVRRRAQLPKDCKLHGGRHFFITRALMRGLDLATVAALVGHQSTNTTQIYTHLIDKSDFLNEAAAKAVGIAGGPAPSGLEVLRTVEATAALAVEQEEEPLPTVADLPAIPPFRSSWRLCWAALQQACEQDPKLRRLTDKQMLAWLREHSPFANWLPGSAETFSRHLSTARMTFGLGKRRTAYWQCKPIARIRDLLVPGPMRAPEFRQRVLDLGVPEAHFGKLIEEAGARRRKVGGSGGYWVYELNPVLEESQP